MRIEHPRVLAIARHAFALEVSDVLGQRRRTEARALMAHDARFHHHAPGVRSQPDRDRRPATAAEPGPAPALARSEAVADMARPSSRPASPRRRRSAGACRHGCRDGCVQAGRAGRRRASSWRRASGRSEATALGCLKSLDYLRGSASSGCWWRWRIPQSSQPHTPRRRPAFSLAVRGLVASAPLHPHPNLSDGPPDTDKTEGSS